MQDSRPLPARRGRWLRNRTSNQDGGAVDYRLYRAQIAEAMQRAEERAATGEQACSLPDLELPSGMLSETSATSSL